jgi:hypothetical protein
MRHEALLEIAPRNIFSNTYEFRTASHELVALRASLWRERAEFDLQGSQYRLQREGRLTGPFLLERDGRVIARAVKPSAFRERFEIEANGTAYTLRKPSAFRRRFYMFSGEQQIGEIAPVNAFSRRARINLPDDIPLAEQLFIFWLALLMWKRRAAAASAT